MFGSHFKLRAVREIAACGAVTSDGCEFPTRTARLFPEFAKSVRRADMAAVATLLHGRRGMRETVGPRRLPSVHWWPAERGQGIFTDRCQVCR